MTPAGVLLALERVEQDPVLDCRDRAVVVSPIAGISRDQYMPAFVGDILGHTQDELVGVPLLDLIAPGFGEMLQAAMAELVSGRAERIRQSQRMLRKDGEVARLSLVASLLRGADDEPSHFVVVVEDGTELVDCIAVPHGLNQAGGVISNEGLHTTVLTNSSGESDTQRAPTLLILSARMATNTYLIVTTSISDQTIRLSPSSPGPVRCVDRSSAGASCASSPCITRRCCSFWWCCRLSSRCRR